MLTFYGVKIKCYVQRSECGLNGTASSRMLITASVVFVVVERLIEESSSECLVRESGDKD